RSMGPLIRGNSAARRLVESPQDFQDDTTTDDEGHFRLIVPATGETLLLASPDTDFTQCSQYIADRRGDVGLLTLKPGRSLTGRILDTDNKAVAGRYVFAELQAPTPDSAPDLVKRHAFFGRRALTDERGSFTLSPLPPGEYTLKPLNPDSDLTTEHGRVLAKETHPAAAYFAPLRVILADAVGPERLEIRATPTIQVS